MMLEIQVLAWDRHTNVAGLNFCMFLRSREYIFFWIGETFYIVCKAFFIGKIKYESMQICSRGK